MMMSPELLFVYLKASVQIALFMFGCMLAMSFIAFLLVKSNE